MCKAMIELIAHFDCHILKYQYEGDSSLFEDDETRMFYENLPDLRAFIPKVSHKLYTFQNNITKLSTH